MDHLYEFTIHDQREINKINLETFTLDQDFSFDRSINKLIDELKKENEESNLRHNRFIDLEKNNPEKYKEVIEIAERNNIHIDLQKYEYMESIIFNEEQLTVLSEMKIIYAYKLFEVRIKKLIKIAFSVNTESFYRWSTLIEFLKEKNIQATSLKGYSEIMQLQSVNNSLKHSDELSQKLSLIKEFQGIEQLSYLELNKFYDRVQPFPSLFLSALSNALYNELYEFDQEKLMKLAKSYVIRMDKNTALTFIDILKKSY